MSLRTLPKDQLLNLCNDSILMAYTTPTTNVKLVIRSCVVIVDDKRVVHSKIAILHQGGELHEYPLDELEKAIGAFETYLPIYYEEQKVELVPHY